jgi:hypothetical protein
MSVVTWLPTQEFALDANQISGAWERLAELFSAPPLTLQVQTSAPVKGGSINRLIVSRCGAQAAWSTKKARSGEEAENGNCAADKERAAWTMARRIAW